MNFRVARRFFEKHVVTAWDAYKNTFPEPRRSRLRLVWIWDHHPGHLRYMGCPATRCRLWREDIGMCLVGRECTSLQQMVDTGSPARSLKQHLRRTPDDRRATLIQEMKYMLECAQDYCTQYSSPDQFARNGYGAGTGGFPGTHLHTELYDFCLAEQHRNDEQWQRTAEDIPYPGYIKTHWIDNDRIEREEAVRAAQAEQQERLDRRQAAADARQAVRGGPGILVAPPRREMPPRAARARANAQIAELAHGEGQPGGIHEDNDHELSDSHTDPFYG
eukprot:g19168.t1